MTFHEEYVNCCNTPSDINEHLPLLFELGCNSETMVEFGVGYGRSTRAFLAALEKTHGSLDSFEMKVLPGVQELFDTAKEQYLNAKLHVGDLLENDLFPMDLLLVDSHHTYHQVNAELTKFGGLAQKYIIFHDTELYGLSGQDPGSVGIWPAINEFLDAHPEWKIIEQRYNNNGLLVVEKQ